MTVLRGGVGVVGEKEKGLMDNCVLMASMGDVRVKKVMDKIQLKTFFKRKIKRKFHNIKLIILHCVIQ